MRSCLSSEPKRRAAIAWTSTLPMTVASTGPARTGKPLARGRLVEIFISAATANDVNAGISCRSGFSSVRSSRAYRKANESRITPSLSERSRARACHFRELLFQGLRMLAGFRNVRHPGKSTPGR